MAELHYGESGAKSVRPVRIIADSPRRIQELSLLARECGAKITGEGGLPSPPQPPENSAAAACLLIDFPSISERQPSEMDDLSSYIESSSTDALVWADMETLDDAFALLPQDRCHFLIGPSDVEAVLLLTRAITRGNMNQFHSNSRDEGYEELHKISSELADVVRTLTQFAETRPSRDAASARPAGSGSPVTSSVLADAPVSFRPAAPSVMQPLSAPANPSASDIRKIIQLRRMRDNFFDATLFADPAWDILLDLMAARLEQSRVSVSSLCIAAAVPPTTALRWITSMTKAGLLKRHQDPNDARRVFLHLSDDAAQKITEYLRKASEYGLLPI